MLEAFLTFLIPFLLISILILFFKLRDHHAMLSFRIIIALLLGLGFGVLLKLANKGIIIDACKDVLYFIGHGYLALLKMLVIPLILTSIIHAIVNIGTNSNDSLKRISFLTCFMLLGMTALSSLIAILVGKYFVVGAGLSIPDSPLMPKHAYQGLIETLLSMLPSNPIGIMVQENTIAVVLFAVLIGIAARMLDEKDHDKMETFTKLISSLFAIVKKLATLILRTTPYGIFAMMALLILEQGITVINGMVNYFLAMYVAMIMVFLMHSFILAFMGFNPWSYFKNAYLPLLVAFTTRSSFGTMPVSEETLRKKFNTKQIVATFVPSIGATMGMNACAGIFPAMLVVMTLTILHQPLTWQLILLVMFINSIASLGISGIPGTAYIAASVTLTSLNLPFGIVALVQGIDPIIDMGRTATNVNGMLTTALIVDRSKQIE